MNCTRIKHQSEKNGRAGVQQHGAHPRLERISDALDLLVANVQPRKHGGQVLPQRCCSDVHGLEQRPELLILLDALLDVRIKVALVVDEVAVKQNFPHARQDGPLSLELPADLVGSSWEDIAALQQVGHPCLGAIDQAPALLRRHRGQMLHPPREIRKLHQIVPAPARTLVVWEWGEPILDVDAVGGSEPVKAMKHKVHLFSKGEVPLHVSEQIERVFIFGKRLRLRSVHTGGLRLLRNEIHTCTGVQTCLSCMLL